MSVEAATAVENSPVLNKDGQKLFRSGTMRAAYLSQDRVDVSEVIGCHDSIPLGVILGNNDCITPQLP